MTGPMPTGSPVGESCAAPRRRDPRQEFLFPNLRRNGGNELEDDLALGVHQVGLGCAVHAPINRRAAVLVEGHSPVGIAELLEQHLALFPTFLVLEPIARITFLP